MVVLDRIARVGLGNALDVLGLSLLVSALLTSVGWAIFLGTTSSDELWSLFLGFTATNTAPFAVAGVVVLLLGAIVRSSRPRLLSALAVRSAAAMLLVLLAVASAGIVVDRLRRELDGLSETYRVLVIATDVFVMIAGAIGASALLVQPAHIGTDSARSRTRRPLRVVLELMAAALSLSLISAGAAAVLFFRKFRDVSRTDGEGGTPLVGETSLAWEVIGRLDMNIGLLTLLLGAFAGVVTPVGYRRSRSWWVCATGVMLILLGRAGHGFPDSDTPLESVIDAVGAFTMLLFAFAAIAFGIAAVRAVGGGGTADDPRLPESFVVWVSGALLVSAMLPAVAEIAERLVTSQSFVDARPWGDGERFVGVSPIWLLLSALVLVVLSNTPQHTATLRGIRLLAVPASLCVLAIEALQIRDASTFASDRLAHIVFSLDSVLRTIVAVGLLVVAVVLASSDRGASDG